MYVISFSLLTDMSEYVSKQRIRYNIHFDKIKELVEAGNMWDWNDAIKVNDSDSIGRSLGFINMGQIIIVLKIIPVVHK